MALQASRLMLYKNAPAKYDAIMTNLMHAPILDAPAKTSKPLPRNVSIDVLKLVLAFMVVGLHTGMLYDVTPTLGYLAVEGVFRIAVPVFLIINGFYFFPVMERGDTRRWFSRIISLYVFWTVIYACFWAPPLSLSVFGISKFVVNIIFGYSHLWYLTGMVGAALVMILLKNWKPRSVLFISLALYFVGVSIQYAGNYHIFTSALLDKAANAHRVHRSFLLLCFPFFYFGFAINKFRLHERISARYAWCAVMVGLGLLLLESYLNFSNPRNDGGFDNFLTLLLVCPAIFIAVHNVKLYSTQKRIALYSSGVYLVHYLVLLILWDQTDIHMSSLTFLVVCLSLAMTAALIPLSRRAPFIL